MKLILSTLIFAAVCSAQTAVTITITIPAGAAPVVEAWRKTQCLQKDVAGACIQPQYANVKAVIQAKIQDAVNAHLALVWDWALTSTDASLPNAVKKAKADHAATQATLDNAKTAVVADVK